MVDIIFSSLKLCFIGAAGLWIFGLWEFPIKKKKKGGWDNGWDYEHEKALREEVEANLPDNPTKGQRVAVPGAFKPSSWIFYVEEPMPDWLCDNCCTQGVLMSGHECEYCEGKGRIESPPFNGWRYLYDEDIDKHEEWKKLTHN